MLGYLLGPSSLLLAYDASSLHDRFAQYLTPSTNAAYLIFLLLFCSLKCLITCRSLRPSFLHQLVVQRFGVIPVLQSIALK
jgi:hypothetical protein